MHVWNNKFLLSLLILGLQVVIILEFRKCKCYRSGRTCFVGIWIIIIHSSIVGNFSLSLVLDLVSKWKVKFIYRISICRNAQLRWQTFWLCESGFDFQCSNEAWKLDPWWTISTGTAYILLQCTTWLGMCRTSPFSTLNLSLLGQARLSFTGVATGNFGLTFVHKSGRKLPVILSGLYYCK